jgi:hypothetical protein
MRIIQWGKVKLSSAGNQFLNAANMTVAAQDLLNTTGTTSFSGLFSGCTALASVPHIISWDLTAVTSLDNTFSGCSSFNDAGISGWNTSHVTTAQGTFFSAAKFNQPLSGWSTTKITNLAKAFQGAKNFNRNLATWDISAVSSLNFAFSGAVAFDQDLSAWRITALTSAASMFSGVKLSLNNYDALIVSWAAQAMKLNRTGVVFDGGNSQFRANSLASVAHNNLTLGLSSQGKGWSITDGSSVASTACYTNDPSSFLDLPSSCGSCTSNCTLAAQKDPNAAGIKSAQCEAGTFTCDFQCFPGLQTCVTAQDPATCATNSSTDYLFDDFNCGKCGNSCDFNSRCVRGECLCSDGSYGNFTTNSNCGQCNNACNPPDYICLFNTNFYNNYSCISQCPNTPTAASCPGNLVCIDTTSDPSNCGGCANNCDSPSANSYATCSNSTCGYSCDSGFETCPTVIGTGACDVNSANDYDADAQNCGFCGNSCNNSAIANGVPFCNQGSCDYSCAAGWQTCATSLVHPDVCALDVAQDYLSDNLNCGVCGHQCNFNGTVCIAGQCACPTSDFTTNSHCGDCGTACSGGEECAAVSGAYYCISTSTSGDGPAGAAHRLAFPLWEFFVATILLLAARRWQ